MNKYLVISFAGLLVLAAALPIYAMLEPGRMAGAQESLRQRFVSDAAVIYVENCAVCHGAAGEGVGATPALANPALRESDFSSLFKVIARGRYNTAMAGWHEDEGGILNDYQVEEMVALVRYVDWAQVGELSAQRGVIPPTLPVPDVDPALFERVAALDAQGAQWAEGLQIFAENCTTCHGVNGEGTGLGVPLNTPDVRAKDGAELARTIREGVPGTMMAAWDRKLGTEKIEPLVSLLKNWDRIGEAGIALDPPAPVRIDVNNPEEVLALGERTFNQVCASCHGENGSGGTGPVLNSQQFFNRNTTDATIRNTIVNGGWRPVSTMPAFGDRMTSVEIDSLVSYIRSWEPDAPWVANPRGTQQGGGGPPWLRATPDPNNPVAPGRGRGQGGRRGSTQGASGQGTGQTPATGGSAVDGGTGQAGSGQSQGTAQPAGPPLTLAGEVVTLDGSQLTFRVSDGTTRQAMLGPAWYWPEQGIALTPGDRIELEGFESAGHMEVNWITNVTTGATHRLRTPEGVPVWQGP